MNWKDYLQFSNASEDDKKLIYRYGDILENRGFRVILDLNHFSTILHLKLATMASMVNAPTYFYRSFQIPKRRSGEFRQIDSPYPVLSMVQEWILSSILQKIEVDSHCFSFRRGFSIVQNAATHLSSASLYKLDLKDFFPSIPLKRNIAIFLKCGYSSKVSFYLGALTSLKNGLPQGAPTSPMISNIACKRLDLRLQRLSARYQLTYSRYADDLCFSGIDISPMFRNMVKAIIKDEKFEVNPKKEVLAIGANRKKIVTGISISDGAQLKIPREYKRAIKLDVFKLLKHDYLVDPAKPDFDPLFFERILGRLNYWKQVEVGDSHVKSLIEKVRKKQKEFLAVLK